MRSDVILKNLSTYEVNVFSVNREKPLQKVKVLSTRKQTLLIAECRRQCYMTMPGLIRRNSGALMYTLNTQQIW